MKLFIKLRILEFIEKDLNNNDKQKDIKKMASADDKSKLVLKINYATSAFGSIMIELLKSENWVNNLPSSIGIISLTAKIL